LTGDAVHTLLLLLLLLLLLDRLLQMHTLIPALWSGRVHGRDKEVKLRSWPLSAPSPLSPPAAAGTGQPAQQQRQMGMSSAAAAAVRQPKPRELLCDVDQLRHLQKATLADSSCEW
jgi:hypothetical protein